MNTEDIQRAIFSFKLAKAFRNKDINKKAKTLTETLMNIFNNFIPNETSPSLTIKNLYGWTTKQSPLWRKGQNLPRYTTIIPRIAIKLCWLIKQMKVPD